MNVLHNQYHLIHFTSNNSEHFIHFLFLHVLHYIEEYFFLKPIKWFWISSCKCTEAPVMLVIQYGGIPGEIWSISANTWLSGVRSHHTVTIMRCGNSSGIIRWLIRRMHRYFSSTWRFTSHVQWDVSSTTVWVASIVYRMFPTCINLIIPRKIWPASRLAHLLLYRCSISGTNRTSWIISWKREHVSCHHPWRSVVSSVSAIGGIKLRIVQGGRFSDTIWPAAGFLSAAATNNWRGRWQVAWVGSGYGAKAGWEARIVLLIGYQP